MNRRQGAYDKAREKPKMSAFFKASWFGKEQRAPEVKLPEQPVDLAAFLASEELAYIWLGHSTILLRLDGKTILLDPIFTTPRRCLLWCSGFSRRSSTLRLYHPSTWS